jgi:hypothetical protein
MSEKRRKFDPEFGEGAVWGARSAGVRSGQPQPGERTEDQDVEEPQAHDHPSCWTARRHRLLSLPIHINAGHTTRTRFSAQ